MANDCSPFTSFSTPSFFPRREAFTLFLIRKLNVKKFSLIKVMSVSALTIALLPHAHAVDSSSVEFATGNKTQFVRVGAQWNWQNKWFESDGRHIGAYWDGIISEWQQNDYQRTGANQRLTDIGITPVFRYQSDDKKGVYAEAGIGMHYLSKIYDNNGRTFSTNFQFGDHIGVGYVTDNGLDFALKVQHFSNGAIKHPNPGANFVVIKMAYKY